MDAATKKDAKSALAITAALAALVTGGVIVSERLTAPAPSVVFSPPLNQPVPPISTPWRLEWDDALSPLALRLGWVTDIYTTTNLKHFTSLGYVTTNRVNVATTDFMGFYVTRHRNTNTGQTTVWNVKR